MKLKNLDKKNKAKTSKIKVLPHMQIRFILVVCIVRI